MADGLKISKRFTAEAEELLIRAQVEDAGGGAFRAITFEKSRVDYITEVQEGVSGIALKTGARIAVAMPYDQLENSIYRPDLTEAPVLDLRDVTGAALKDVKVPDPAKDFAVAAASAPQVLGLPEKKPFIDKPLKIAVFVRQANEQNFQMCFLTDTNIDWSGVVGETNGRNGMMTKLPLRYGKGPFNEETLIIDMPRAAFMEIYNKFKYERLEELDLRD